MFKFTYLLLLLLGTAAAINIETLTKERLQAIKQTQDYQHHFIFFHQPTLDALKAELAAWNEPDIKIYINDCRRNDLPECEDPKQTPVLLLFNRILIRFNGDPTLPQDIIEWGEKRINRSPKYISNREELNGHLASNPNTYCFCQPQNELQGSGLFYTLSKTLPFLNFCIINNAITYTQLGLKANNLTLFLDSAENRRQFEYPNRFEAWQWFAKTNMFPTVQRVAPIVAQRFEQKQKNLQFYALVCGFSLRCDHAWDEINKIQKSLTRQELGYDFKLALQDQKDSFTFNLYFHLAFDLRRLPALVHINLSSIQANAGDLVRQIHYIQRFDRSTLDSFVTRTAKGEIKPFFMSGEVPKNNGFYGKASQKLIQKLVASNAESVISASPNHYILLVTALDIGCEPCQNFYKDYKQIAALLVEKDVTFGILNANLNQVPFKKVTQLPDLLLFKKDSKQEPIRLDVNHSFDHFMLFLKNNLGESYTNPDEL